MSFDVEEFRKGFPQLERTMGPSRLVYFDSGASSLKHSSVTSRVNSYNRFETANVHRGAHHTSRQGTENYEQARKKVQKFVNAANPSEIIFTRGTTESINLVASGFMRQLQAGDEIIISSFEHHSNIVPWQQLCAATGAILKVIPFDKEKAVDISQFERLLSPKVKLLALIHYSNSFGNRLPVEKMINLCQAKGIPTLLDSAQAVLAEEIDVQKMKCDFLCFSGHKMFGPYGIGALYIKQNFLDSLPPYQTGGSMIDRVTFEKTTFADAPQKFEAGTPNIAGAIGLGTACELFLDLDFEAVHNHISSLRSQLLEGLSHFTNIQTYNFVADEYTGVVSFNVKGAHPSDVGTLLDKYGFAVRAGHHCTQPLMDLMKLPGTVRVSFAPYNTSAEVEAFLKTLKKIEEFF